MSNDRHLPTMCLKYTAPRLIEKQEPSGIDSWTWVTPLPRARCFSPTPPISTPEGVSYIPAMIQLLPNKEYSTTT